MKALQGMTDRLGQADDAVQGFLRKRLFGTDDPNQDSEAMKYLAMSAFRARPQAAGDTTFRFTDNTEGRAAMVASRAMQAGGVTAAGAGLAGLTQMVMQFGGPADQQEQGQLPLN